MSFFSALMGGSSKKAALEAMRVQGQAKAEAQGQLDAGYKTATDKLTQAGAQFDPYINPGYAAMYANALGINGADGKTAATDAFRGANPGYQFDYDQGLQGLLRAASAGGNLASGNTLTAAQSYGTGLADKYYQQWLDNLRSGLSSSFAASQGKAGTLGQAGTLGYQLGADKAGVTRGVADNTSNLIGAIGQAKTQGAMNVAGLGLGVLNTATNLFTGGGTGGGGSNLFSLFKTGGAGTGTLY